jgi:RNA polymerase sigma-70 factor (ECF subfamily)
LDGTERALPLSLLHAKRALASGQPENTTVAAVVTDEELLGHIQKRDEGSALALFRRYDKLALSIGLRILQDEGEAEDLVQEIFIRLCSEADSFDSKKGSARTWIIQMIYRRTFDRRAYLNRRQFYRGTDAAEHTNTVIGTRNIEEDIIARLTVQQLETAFNELSERQRETLEMFFFEGLKFAEIAERTGQDLKNVRHHYYRGLERLRQATRQMLRARNFDR